MAEEKGFMIILAWQKIYQIQKYLYQKKSPKKTKALQASNSKNLRAPGSSPQGLHS